MVKTINYAAEIARLEAESDALDQQWRQVRHSGAQTMEEGRARDIELAAVEVAFNKTLAEIARLTLASRELRLGAIDDVDPGALAEAEAAYRDVKARYDALIEQQRVVYDRRRDAERDVKSARQTLHAAEHELEQRKQRRDEIAARPLRGMAPAATWIGDGRT